jgi:hypothetical protein
MLHAVLCGAIYILPDNIFLSGLKRKKTPMARVPIGVFSSVE